MGGWVCAEEHCYPGFTNEIIYCGWLRRLSVHNSTRTHTTHSKPSAPSTGGGSTVLGLPAQSPAEEPSSPGGICAAGPRLRLNIPATVVTASLAKLPNSPIFQPKFDIWFNQVALFLPFSLRLLQKIPPT